MNIPRLVHVILLCAGSTCLSLSASAQSPNLVAHYALNGTALDSSGSGYDGVETAITYVVDPVRGSVASFDGITSSIDISSTGFLYSLGDNPHAQFSLAFWVLPTVDFGTGTTPIPLIILGGSNPGRGVIEIVANGSWSGMGGGVAHGGVGVNSHSGGGKTGNVDTVDIYDGNWHHVVIQWEGDPTLDIEVWMDNVPATTYGNGYNGNSDATTTLRLGGPAAWSQGGGYDKRYTGLLSDVRFYDGQLSTSDVNTIYNQSGMGTRYCIASPNSVGSGAHIYAGGSVSVTANDLMLYSSPVPDQPGLFFYGTTQVQVPFGDGALCIGGQIYFIYPPIMGIANLAMQTVDYPSLPAGGQPLAGSTWNFQYWYRDPAFGGAAFNASDGLELTFTP